jgi:hypothetical protein
MNCLYLLEHDEMDIQIADQSGKPIQLPPGEKRVIYLYILVHCPLSAFKHLLCALLNNFSLMEIDLDISH